MKKTYLLLSLLLFLTSPFHFCRKSPDIPPLKKANDGARISIAALKKRFDPSVAYKFRGDTNLYAVVTADEVSGNLYKDVYVRDATGSLHVKLVASGGLFIGDSIRIHLDGVLLNSYASLIQLDSVDLEKNVVKLASRLLPQPELMSIDQVLANTTATNPVQSRLIQLNGVEFLAAQQLQPYANSGTKAAIQYTLQDCKGNKLSLRTSGYCYFASQLTPAGNGSLVAIASQYYTNVQLILRRIEDVSMSGPLCSPITTTATQTSYLSKNFNDNSVISNGWSIQQVLGAVSWTTSTAGGAPSPYCQISNYSAGSNSACETWLISPPMDLGNASSPRLSFRNAYKYAGPALELYVSTDYNGGDPSLASWTPLTFAASTGSFVFTASGQLDLSAYKSGSTRIAFKYRGTASAGSTWELDDILVREP